MRLKDKVAVITGAGNGLGEADARLFGTEGASVVVSDIDEQRGSEVAREINDSGGNAVFFPADVSSKKHWDALLAHTLERFDRLDILVNNAGISSNAFDENDMNAWEQIMAINATSVYLGTQLAGKIMKKQGKGSIVNISSIFGLVGGETGHPAYHASKAAVRNVTKAFALRFAQHGVRVNSIHPGYMTPMVSAKPRGIDRASKSPMKRVGQPIEVAYGVLFLASDEASYITGAELAIDGGFTAQ